jgi:hypothetical protein
MPPDRLGENMRAPCLAMAVMAGTADAHDWLKGLRAPDGLPCCDGNDCQAVSYRLNQRTGQEEIQIDGHWWTVEPGKVLPQPSPDGRVYACWDRWPDLSYQPYPLTHHVRCIILSRMTSLGAPTVS